MSRKGSSRWFFEDALRYCIVTNFGIGFGDRSSMRQLLLILRLYTNVLSYQVIVVKYNTLDRH